MATFVGLHNKVYVGSYDLTPYTRKVDFGSLTRQMQDATTFNDGGYTSVIPGLISGEASIEGNQDFTNLDPNFSVSQLGSQFAFTVVPNPTGTVSAGDPCWFSRGVIGSLNPMSGAKGDIGSIMLNLGYDTAMLPGQVAHPLGAETGTSSGSALTLTGPDASQKLWAALHVTAFSGFSQVVFKIQSDDSSGFSSATDRITFTTVSGTTSQFSSVAGDFSTETHHRITWTKTGTGSVSFVCVVGVI